MTVKQLIEKLKKLDQNRVVVISSDAEGNNYHALHEVATGGYDGAERSVHPEKITPKMRAEGWSDEDLNPYAKPAVIFYP